MHKVRFNLIQSNNNKLHTHQWERGGGGFLALEMVVRHGWRCCRGHATNGNTDERNYTSMGRKRDKREGVIRGISCILIYRPSGQS